MLWFMIYVNLYSYQSEFCTHPITFWEKKEAALKGGGVRPPAVLLSHKWGTKWRLPLVILFPSCRSEVI